MIIITKKETGEAGSTILNCRPVQRTNRTTTNLIDRAKNIYLIYFKSDMTGRVAYAYAQDINDNGKYRSTYQYSDIGIHQVSTVAEQDVYSGLVCFEPAGGWYYIIYEVYFEEGLSIPYEGANCSLLKAGYAPIDNLGTIEAWDETCVPPDQVAKGILGLAVEEGKLLVEQVPNAVTYNQHTQTNDNYIYTK